MAHQMPESSWDVTPAADAFGAFGASAKITLIEKVETAEVFKVGPLLEIARMLN